MLSDVDVVASVISRRRVTRKFEKRPVSDAHLLQLAESVFSAPSGGGRRPVRVVIVRHTEQVRRVIAFSPGIIGLPPAILALCVDWSVAPHLNVDDPRDTHATHVDVGAAMGQILTLAEAMDLGACPIMSFHRSSVRKVLQAPANWTPLVLITVGHRVNAPEPNNKPLPDGFVYWDRVAEVTNARR